MGSNTTESKAISRLKELPTAQLRPSALVDFVLFFACDKPAVRLIVDTEECSEAMRFWSIRQGLDFASDRVGFACVGVHSGSAVSILEIDRRVEPHEIELGLALGYPLCCCESMACVGESNIDSRAVEIAAWKFDGEYRRINPQGYRSGGALISHLPCSPVCEASLMIANRARKFLLEHKSESMLSGLFRSLDL